MRKSNFKDHFSTGSADYAAYRPSYPIALVDALAAISPSLNRALDCGCGCGQLSVLLAERFNEVLATDASTSQIEKARQHEKVVYHTALAESSGVPAGSIDLITVAQAAHWLDLDKFYKEVRRIAKRKAVIALITYGVLHVEGTVNQPVQRFYHDVIGPYWPPERRHVEDGYRSLPFPFAQAMLPDLSIQADWNLHDLIGYINTWSAVKAAEKTLGANPVTSLLDTLSEQWGDPAARRRVRWPLSVRAGYVHL